MLALLPFVQNGVPKHAGAAGCEVDNRRPVAPAPLGGVRAVAQFRPTRAHGFEAMPKCQNAQLESRRRIRQPTDTSDWITASAPVR